MPPCRGLVCFHNAQGARLDATDVNRWIRLCRLAFAANKADVLAYGQVPDHVLTLPAGARTWLPDQQYGAPEFEVSLRTDGAAPPPEDDRLKDRGWLDVFLCPATETAPHLPAWLDACQRAGLPIRLQFQAPFQPDLDLHALASRVADAGVAAVNVALSDPFPPTDRPNPSSPPTPSRGQEDSRRTVDAMNALVEALADRHVEANLIGLPLCLTTEQTLGHAENARQFFLDHQQYDRAAFDLAVRLYHRKPRIAARIVMLLMARDASFRNPLDEIVLNWLDADHPLLYSGKALADKVAYDLRRLRRPPESVPNERAQATHEAETIEPPQSAICRECALRRICDGDTPQFRHLLPGLSVTARSGDLELDPMHFLAQQPKHYDAVDTSRARSLDTGQAFARQARDRMAQHPPTPVNQAEGALGGACQAPFAMAATFDGGTAEAVGFSVTRHVQLLCPIIAKTHRVALYVAKDGRYILLRDGEPVQPIALAAPYYVPRRLPQRMREVRLVAHKASEGLAASKVEVWDHLGETERDRPAPKYSVLIVCSRFSRRLQAVLRSIAHQRDVDLAQIEVIVAYVPGIDATDDVIDAMHLACPGLHIVRSPFTSRQANAKGFMINESRRLASGEWIFLLDSDILLPPDMLARVEAVADNSVFVAPDGRKMLDAETTARILLGEIVPWRAWDQLLAGPGDLRQGESEGLPIGFCQIVKASCFEQVTYKEHGHYEGADFDFAVAMRKTFGPEVRLDGVPVLHMDHGGSQWYGTPKQL